MLAQDVAIFGCVYLQTKYADFKALQTDVDSIPSVFLPKILFLGNC